VEVNCTDPSPSVSISCYSLPCEIVNYGPKSFITLGSGSTVRSASRSRILGSSVMKIQTCSSTPLMRLTSTLDEATTFTKNDNRYLHWPSDWSQRTPTTLSLPALDDVTQIGQFVWVPSQLNKATNLWWMKPL